MPSVFKGRVHNTRLASGGSYKEPAMSSAHLLRVHSYPRSSTRSHNTLCDGMKGDPSYKTVAIPDARPVTSQFHIIHPVCRHKDK